MSISESPPTGGYAAALIRGASGDTNTKDPPVRLSPEATAFMPTNSPPPPPRPSGGALHYTHQHQHQHHHYFHVSNSHVQMCANCGSQGHMYRVCQHPVSSFGIICIRRRMQMQMLPTEVRHAAIRAILPATPFDGQVEEDDEEKPTTSCLEYLMVQRKDSLSFVEFVRGKYNIQNRGYLLKLLSGMTTEERVHLVTKSFDELWHGFWQSGHSRTFFKEYEQSKARFTMLKSGYYIRPVSMSSAGSSGEEFFSLAVALNSTTSNHFDTEFGFPKGRRNINETDLQCALREFSEETGILVSDITVLSNVGGPCEEIFTGSNGVRYRHVYYVAELKPESRVWDYVGVIPVVDPVQLREVKSVGWFDAEGVMERLRVENSERREMFSDLTVSLEKK